MVRSTGFVGVLVLGMLARPRVFFAVLRMEASQGEIRVSETPGKRPICDKLWYTALITINVAPQNR